MGLFYNHTNPIYIYIFYLFSLTSAVVVLPSFSIHSPSPHLLLSIIPLFLCCYFSLSLSLSLSLSIVPGLPFSYSLLMTFLSYFSMFSNYIHDFDFWLLIFWCLVFGCWENMRKQREIGFFFFLKIYIFIYFLRNRKKLKANWTELIEIQLVWRRCSSPMVRSRYQIW